MGGRTSAGTSASDAYTVSTTTLRFTSKEDPVTEQKSEADEDLLVGSFEIGPLGVFALEQFRCPECIYRNKLRMGGRKYAYS